MNTERLRYLYQQYQLGQLTQAESQEWEKAIADLSNDASLLSLLDKDWDLEDFKAPVLMDAEQERIFNYVVAQPQNRRKIRSLWPRIAAAASIILAIGAGIFFYTNRSKTDAVQTVSHVNDVAPGKQGATLTLANGEKIRLSAASNGELAKQAGVTVSKTANGQLVYEFKPSTQAEIHRGAINTLTTAKGETYQLRLPDGSLVWLNAASSLTYAANLNERGKRRVRLEGEGYFEITKDKTHPFVVESNGQEVEVLGTHFNVNAYVDENNVKTTLIEGSVRVTAPSKGGVMLLPGQQATMGASKEINVQDIDAQTAVAWKNGEFVFERENIKSIMRKLARWYNVDVIYEGDVEKKALWGSISKYSNVSKVLEMLSGTGAVAFEIRSNSIIVKPVIK